MLWQHEGAERASLTTRVFAASYCSSGPQPLTPALCPLPCVAVSGALSFQESHWGVLQMVPWAVWEAQVVGALKKGVNIPV